MGGATSRTLKQHRAAAAANSKALARLSAFARCAKRAAFADFFMKIPFFVRHRVFFCSAPCPVDNKFLPFSGIFTPSSFAIFFLSWHSASGACDAEFERFGHCCQLDRRPRAEMARPNGFET